MKVYHEIYPIEGWADKISKHLGEIVEDRPNMYAKTKQRYTKLAVSLLDSVSKIALLLEEDSLVSKSEDEFNELFDKQQDIGITDKLNVLVRRVQQLDKFSSNSNVEPSTSDISKSNRAAARSHFETIEFFDRVFKESSVYNFGYSEVNECARMLYLWFHTRFCPDIVDTSFKYNIHYLSTWICNFIVAYGKYHHAGQNKQFVATIERWCEEVKLRTVGNYAIPYCVYQIEKEHDPSDYTIDSVVINDILANGCLYKLNDECEGIVHYDHNILVTVVKDRNPSLHSKIVTRIAKRNQLIQEIGLTPVGGIDSE